jgi:hypothetical protein
MPIHEMIYLSAIISAFIIFAVVLGWAEVRTRHN